MTISYIILLVPIFDLREYFTGDLKRKEYNLMEIIYSAPLYTEEVPEDAIVGVMFSMSAFMNRDEELQTSMNIYGVMLLTTQKTKWK